MNYLSDFPEAEQEQQALDQLCDYLVLKGKYKDRDAAHKDAGQRVDFLEKADFFSADESLADASAARKSIAALIQGHGLRGVLEDNDGYLPGMDAPEAQRTPAPNSAARDSSPSAAATPVAGKRSITEIFGAIELDLRTGMSEQQIISKLEDSGIARDNAEDALAVVLRQRKQKRRTRLLAAGSIVLLSLVLFYFAR
ncbi:MAG: hypothetical protein PsegKO_33760 [Pseudohongiellaceae bacterium]|jgi:hypothetical protein